MTRKYTFSMGGIHPDKFKITSNCPIEDAGLPEMVYIPVKQHIGSSAKIMVNKGDKVKVGTLIADADGIVSSDVHSSVSGEVIKIEDIAGSTGYEEKMITIKVEGDEWEESIDRSDKIIKEINFTPEEIVKKIREAGITVPVIPGVMPITNANQVKRSIKLSGSFMAQRFNSLVDKFGYNPAAMKQAGIAYATDQIIDLYANGITNVHVYSMNKPDVAAKIQDNLSDIIKK